MDEDRRTTQRRGDRPRHASESTTPAPATTPTATTPTRRTVTRTTATLRTPTPTTRTPASAARAATGRSRRSSAERFLAEHWERSRSSSRARRRAASTTSSPRGTSSGCHRDRDQDAGLPARQGRRDRLGLHDRPLLAAVAVHGRRRRPARAAPSSKRAPRSSSRASTTPGCRSRATAASSRRTSGTPRRRTRTTRRAARRGCPVHHDTHEVFSLQVAGEKRWLVYEPVLELPLKDQRYRSGARRARASRCSTSPCAPATRSTCRAAGSTRRSRPSSDSLHVTVGVNVRRWIDAARARARRARRGDARVRRSIDRRRAAGAARELDAEAAERRARERFVRSRRPILDGQLSELRALDDARPRHGARAPRHRDRRPRRHDARLRGQGAALPGAAARRSSSSSSRRRSRSRGRDLPGALDDAGRLVLRQAARARGVPAT